MEMATEGLDDLMRAACKLLQVEGVEVLLDDANIYDPVRRILYKNRNRDKKLLCVIDANKKLLTFTVEGMNEYSIISIENEEKAGRTICNFGPGFYEVGSVSRLFHFIGFETTLQRQ